MKWCVSPEFEPSKDMLLSPLLDGLCILTSQPNGQGPDLVQEIQRLSAQVEEVLHWLLLLALVGLLVQQLYVHL